MFRSFRAAVLLVLLGLALGGCRTSATVSVRSDAAGKGVVALDVALDHDATLGLGTGKARVLTADLAAAGWAVSGPQSADAGGSTIHAEKSFAAPGQANAALQELTGRHGALSTLRLTRKQTLTGSRVALKGSADLEGGLGMFGDARLRALTGSSSDLGIDDAEVARQAGGALGDSFRFALSADLIGTAKRWDVKIGTRQAVLASANRVALQAPAGIAAIVLSMVGLVVLLASARRTDGAR